MLRSLRGFQGLGVEKVWLVLHNRPLLLLSVTPSPLMSPSLTLSQLAQWAPLSTCAKVAFFYSEQRRTAHSYIVVAAYFT